jgi:hypothetical protein
MEAAPADLQSAGWGLWDEDVSGTGTGIGSGKRNTELIIVALNRKGESGKAAQLCGAYTLNGYSDWFLPSKDELDVLYNAIIPSRINSYYDKIRIFVILFLYPNIPCFPPYL